MAASVRHAVSATASGSTITVDPSGLTYSSGDVLVLFVFGYTSLGAPSGSDLTWTERLSDTQAGPFSNTDIHKVWTAVADASITSFTIAHGLNDQYGYTLVAVSGADTSTPLDGTAGITSNTFGSASDAAAPSVTTTGSDSLLLCGAGLWPGGSATRSWTPPTGMTEVAGSDQGGWDRYSVAYQQLAASGATGTKTFTESPAESGGAAWIASSIAIKSAAAGGTDATATPAVIATTVALPQATASGATNATPTPAAIAATAALPAAGLNVSAGPAVIPVVVDMPSWSVNISTSPSVIPVTVALPPATATTAGNVTASPAVVACTVALPAAGVNVASGPAVIETTVTVPLAAPAGGTTVAPAVIPVTVTMPAASAGGTTVVQPEAVAATVTIPAAAVGATAGPSVITLTVTLPTPETGARVAASSSSSVLAAVAATAAVTAVASSSSSVSGG